MECGGMTPLWLHGGTLDPRRTGDGATKGMTIDPAQKCSGE